VSAGVGSSLTLDPTYGPLPGIYTMWQLPYISLN